MPIFSRLPASKKRRVTVRFLKRKMEEYEIIRKEIEELKKEAGEA